MSLDLGSHISRFITQTARGSIVGRLNDHVFSTYFGNLHGFLELDGRRALVSPNGGYHMSQ